MFISNPMFKKTIMVATITAIVVSAVLIANYYILAWTPPGADPPAGGGAITIDASGNVGIGVTTPGYNLHIRNSTDSAVYLEADTDNVTETDNAFIKFSQDNTLVQAILGTVGSAGRDPENVAYTGTLGNSTLLGTLDGNGNLQFGTNDNVRMTIDTAGNVGIGETAPGERLDVNGNVEANAFLYSSDRSLKENIQVIPNALEKVLKLEGVLFEWKDSGKLSIGLIAQDVENVFPELIKTNKNSGLKTLQYGNLVAPLIEAIKEQQAQIEALEKQIKELQSR